MAGRKPKPTAVKKLGGNPGKRKPNKNEPVPAKGMPTCPDWLMPEATKEWERLAELMNQMGVLTEVDMVALAAYCQSYARWKGAQEHITSGGSTFETDKGYQQQTPWVGIANTNQKLMLQAASEFGLGFIGYETGNKEWEWRFMFRSKGDWLDLNLFLETFGGGGHFNAAGWTMQLSPENTIEALVLRFLERVKTLKGEDVSLL